MKPVIVLIGRQNVGKSTLFNNFTHTHDALVADFPGLTRDRRYGCARVKDHEFICIDTGGINVSNTKKDSIESYINEQSLSAIEEANIILFIVDAHSGLMPMDSIIAKHLHLCKKLTFLVINKIDGMNINQSIAVFLSLGFVNIYPLSALYGRGVANLLKTVLLPFFREFNFTKKSNKNNEYSSSIEKNEKKLQITDFTQQSLPIKIAIVGCPNVGKSMLVNRILGKNRMVVYDMPGTTRDSIYIPIQHSQYKRYVLIDTAGIRKRRKISSMVEKFSVIKTFQAIKDANVVLLVFDARKGISDQDLSLLELIINNGRSFVIAINKWDILNQIEKKQMKKMLNYHLDFINFTRLHFVSALYGKGIEDLLCSVREAYNNSIRRISTTILMRIMKIAVGNYQPPLMYDNRRAKLKYVHVGGHSPFTIVIHGNQVKDLPNHYKRYLVNHFQRSLKMIGTPLYLRFKEGINPYKTNIRVNVNESIN